MKAIQVLENGGPEVLKIKELPQPKPKKGECVVRIKAAGVNFIDIYQRRGIYSVDLPYTPGLEAAGIVESVGEGVTEVKVGDCVAYVHEPGSYAEYNLVRSQFLIPLPKELSFEQGAAFPLQGMTAHYLLHEFHKVKRQDTILIHAAAGGMGLLLTQWAHHLGARVIATVSNDEKAKRAKSAGADEVILYTKQDFVQEVMRITKDKGVELIIDGVGKTTFAGNLKAAAMRGHIIIFGSASGAADPISPNALMPKALTLSGGTLFNFIQSKEEMMMRAKAVLEGIQKGWLKLNIDQVFPLDQASKAHERLESRISSGKILLKP